MKTSDQINEIAKALAKAQGEMKAPVKDREGNFVKEGKKAKYSSIDAIWDCVQKTLPQNELCVVQDLVHVNQGITIETTVIHSSGQWITFGPFYLPAEAQTAHKYASACTYARRYSLCAALCINGDDDDDGTIANSHPPKKTEEYNLPKDKQEEVKKAVETSIPFIPLSDGQKDTIHVLVNMIKDDSFLKDLRVKAKVSDLTMISAHRFKELIGVLEAKVVVS